MSLPTSEDEILLLHNPKCSKSRATLALLEENAASFTTRLYLESPLDREELTDLGHRLGKQVVEYTRTKQEEFTEAGLSRAASDDAILDAIVASPILMERPIVIRGKRAAIGRPPENVLSLLDGGLLDS